MVKINTYATVTPALGDKVLGTDTSDTGNDANGETVNFLLSDIFKTLARERLTANRTYYVDPTSGSDANSGLSSGAGAFATIQKAIDTIRSSLDVAGYDITIQLADDTYTGAVALSGWVGGGTITIQGNSGTPSNVHLTRTGDIVTTSGMLPGVVTIKDLKLTATSNHCIYHKAHGIIRLSNLEFGASLIHLRASGAGAEMDCADEFGSTGYTISGGAAFHYVAQNGGMVSIRDVTVTLSGTPAFSTQFAFADILAALEVQGVTFSGAATGTRYLVNNNAVIYTNAAGATYLPGDASGSASNGGIYN